MSYEKQTWQTGDVITAEKLNHIEDGVEAATLTTIKITGDTLTVPKGQSFSTTQVINFPSDGLKRDNIVSIFTVPNGNDSDSIGLALGGFSGLPDGNIVYGINVMGMTNTAVASTKTTTPIVYVTYKEETATNNE